MLPNWLWKQVEKRYIFFPTYEIEMTPAQLGLAYEDVFFSTVDGVLLHGWYVPGSGNGTWLWFHGNGGNVGHRVTELALLHHRLGVNLLIFDYQRSGGPGLSPATSWAKCGTVSLLRAFLGNGHRRGTGGEPSTRWIGPRIAFHLG